MEIFDWRFLVIISGYLGIFVGGSVAIGFDCFVDFCRSIKELKNYLLSQKAEKNIENVKE